MGTLLVFFCNRCKKSRSNNSWIYNILLRIAIVIIILLFLHISVLYNFVVDIHSKSFYNNPVTGVIGFIIFLLGLSVSVWARLNLAKNWGMPMTTKGKTNLITTGPYAYIRHPIYTGMIIAMLGTTIAMTILWVIPFIFLSAYFIYSSKIEEKNMLQQFPKEYGAYKKRTKALIPFIY